MAQSNADVPSSVKADSANWPALLPKKAGRQTVQPDDHSEVVPLLPIPNRTVKRLSADDSADSRVKVGHRQAINSKPPSHPDGGFSSAVRFRVGLGRDRVVVDRQA